MSPKNKKKLDGIRKKLDNLDNKFLSLIKYRTSLVKEVLKLKEYKKEIVLSAFIFDAETTFFIFSIVLTLSPGTMRSGLYPVEKSLLKSKFDFFSNKGVQISSVTPG